MLPCHRTKHDQGDCEGMALTLLRTVVESAPLLASTNLQQTVSFMHKSTWNYFTLISCFEIQLYADHMRYSGMMT